MPCVGANRIGPQVTQYNSSRNMAMNTLRYMSLFIRRNIYLFCPALYLVLLSACASQSAPPSAAQATLAPQPTLARPPAPPALAALAGRAKPCDTLASGVPAAVAGSDQQPAAPDTANAAVVHYDDRSNTIFLRKGAQTTLAGISRIVNRPEVLEQLAPG